MLTLLIIRDMQIKTTMRYYFTPVRRTLIKKSTNNKYWKGCGEKGILCTVGGSVQFNQFSSVQSLSRLWLFVTPWTAACQAFLSITNSGSLLKLMSIELVMPSNHLILCCPLFLWPSIFPSIRVFSNELFVWGGQSTGVSALASFLPKKSQDWSPSDWTGRISL